MYLTVDLGVVSLIPSRSHTFVAIDHEISSTFILLPLIQEGLSVTRESMCTKYWLMLRVVQSVTCLAADTCLTVDPGVASSTPARSHTLLEIDHEIISTAILPSADSRRVVVRYRGKYVHEVLVIYLVKLAQEKSVVR